MAGNVDMGAFAKTAADNPTEKTRPSEQNPLKNPGMIGTAPEINVGNGADTIAASSESNKAMDDTYGYHVGSLFNRSDIDTARQTGQDDNFSFGKVNVPIDSPFANYNNMSWEDTQRLARLADAYNNSYEWQPAQLNLAQGQASVPGLKRVQPISTEEQRRMDMTRQGLAQQQSQALSRNNEVLAYPQQLTAMFDKKGADAQSAAINIQQNWNDYIRRAKFDNEYSAQYQATLQRYMQWWGTEMQQYQNGKVATLLYNEMASNPQYAAWMASVLTSSVLPNAEEYLAGQITKQMMASAYGKGLNEQDTWTAIKGILEQMAGADAAMAAKYNTYTNALNVRGTLNAFGTMFNGGTGFVNTGR